MKKIKFIKYLVLIILIANISLLKAESNSLKNIKATYTGQTIAAGDWTNAANWNKASAPDPTSEKCNLTFYHDVTYNPGENPWTWTNNTEIIVKTGAILTINTNLNIGSNFDFIVEPGGQLIINGDLYFVNNVDGTIDGEVYITGDLTVGGGHSSDIEGAGSLIVDGTITDNTGSLDDDLIAGIERWLIVDNGTWSLNTSWSNTSGGTEAISSPNNQCIVHIENGYTAVLNGNATITELDVQTGGVLNIDPNLTLTVTDNVVSDGEIIIKSDANGTGGLIYNGATPVTAKCERYVSANEYHYVSSPMTEAPVSSYNVTSGGYTNSNFYFYDETETNEDRMYAWRQSTAGNLTPGVGYALYTDENYAYSLQGGVLNNQDFDVTITNTTGAGGSQSWNLIGNPFPCSIDGDTFIDFNDDATVFTGSLYFWDDDGSGSLDYSSADYLVYTKGGGTTGGNGGISNGIIAPMQAFFVQADDATGDLTFPTSAKTASNGTFLKSISPVFESPLEIIRLSLSNNEGLYNDILIKFADDADEGVDIYDGIKLKGNKNIAFYSILNEEHYAIQGLSSDYDDISIPLGMDANINSEYTIKAEGFVNVDETTIILLEDKELDRLIDLRKEDYTFSLFGTDTERFVIHINAEKNNDSSDIYEKSSILNNIYTIDNIVYINEVEFESIANIYDVTGKLIISKNIQRGNSTLELNVNPGCYIIKLMTENEVNSKKIIIQ